VTALLKPETVEENCMDRPSFLIARDGLRLAYEARPGRSPTVVFLSGFNSDMTGIKAEHLAQWCACRGQGFLRLDYSGHGASDGQFTDGTISRWRDDALAVMDAASEGPVVLVGSSMGGWIALLVALARPARVIGLVGVAAAPDFTEALMWEAMAPAEREMLGLEGTLITPNEYGPPLQITLALIEDGRRNLLLDAPIHLDIPVRLLHGQQDNDVPWERSLKLAHRITGNDVHCVFIKDAEHRLSRASDLAVLERLLGGVLDVRWTD
jgi:pimeloyl-ACP methyl ester carboxylesterase